MDRDAHFMRQKFRVEQASEFPIVLASWVRNVTVTMLVEPTFQ